MPDQQQSASSAQAISNSSCNPDWKYEKPRKGKVMAAAYEYYPKMAGYIQIVPTDNLGPLNNEKGYPTTYDEFGCPTNTDVALVIESDMLINATEHNRHQQAKDKANDQGENFDDSKDDKAYFLKMNDRVHLEYSSDYHLIAVKKIN